jgi:phage terminase large subunit-like protein
MRRFHIVYIEVPRKNGKTTMTIPVGLYLLACDQEEGAHVVAAATTRDQVVKTIFQDAQHMARREPGFLAQFGVTVTAHAISQASSASKFEPLAAEDTNLDGLNIHGALIDELHAHKTRGLWDVLETATGSRAQPLIWAITTAGVNRASVCFDQRQHVADVLRGVREDDATFGIIFTLDDGDDPFEEQSWIKANPNYGVSIYPENLKSIAARAQTMPSMRTSFLTRHLDIWINADSSWLPIGAWEACADRDLNLAAFEGQDCFVGIDLATRSDITAVAMLFPPAGERTTWAVFCRYYLPEEVVERVENTHYQGWEHNGLLVGTPGAVTDLDYVIDDLMNLSERFDVREIAHDPWKNLPLITSLEKRGTRAPVVEVRQTAGMLSPAMRELEALILAKAIRFDGDPILTWMISNVVAHHHSNEAITPRKESSEKKIDGVLAILMALDRAQRAQPKPDYTRGLWII